ncbi:MAG: hypothetical protein ONA69_08870, partial [candidate division KSB1 bacterium]|nr:hypothetical protein [candidate division KSB1 bacterium]
EKDSAPVLADNTTASPPAEAKPLSDASTPPLAEQAPDSPATIAELLQRYFAESFGWYGYGVRLGVLRPASDLGSSAAAGIHFPLGRLASNTETAVIVDYWNESRHEKGFHEEWKAFGLSVILRHYLAADEFSISPYLGGGCGLNHSSKFHRSFQTDPAATRTARSTSGLSLQLKAFAGLQFPLAQKRLFFEVNFSAAKVNTLGLYAGIDFLQAAGKE